MGLKRNRLAAGYLYQAQLRAELTRSLGVEWDQLRKGMAELKGVPREAIHEFTTRRVQVLAELARSGAGGFYAAQLAAVETRERKQHLDLSALREDWRARAAEHGLGRHEFGALLGRVREHQHSREQLLGIANRLLGPEGLTGKQTAFSEPEVVRAWSQAHTHGAPAERVRRLASRLTAADGVERVGERPRPGRPARYSTVDLLSVERAALALVERGRDADAPAISEQQLEEIERSDRLVLSGEQERMVREVATTGDRVVCVVGLAGAGKTSATHAVAEVFAHVGIDVLGAAPSGVAAERLQDETGIPSTTLHRLLERAGTAGLPQRSVLVIDEASMAETRVRAPVLRLVEQAQGKAILIGDPQQLPAVGAGGLFAGIVERESAVVLSENRRQHEPLEQDALARVRAPVSAATTSPTRRSKGGWSSPRAPSSPARGCSPTGGSTPTSTLPATSCWRCAAVTSPTSTSSPASSWTPTAASAKTGCVLQSSSSPPATVSSAGATPTCSASRTAQPAP